MKNYFIDTEFIDDGEKIYFISIGVVCEDGREYYAVSKEFDIQQAWSNDWIRENVIPHIIQSESEKTKEDIKADLMWFFHPEKIEDEVVLWGYYCAYDWVAFCQLFGRMIDLPKYFTDQCYDLKQEADKIGIDLEKEVPKNGNSHNALADAWWNYNAWVKLKANE